MNSRLSPVWAAILSLVLAVPAVAGQGIVTIYGVTSNGGSPPTYTCNVSSSAGITVGDHVMAKTTSAGATGVWLVTAKPSATSVTIQDSLTQETGTAFGAPLANVTNGLAYGTPESGTSMIPDGASWWAAAARRNYVVLAEAAPSGAALTRVDDTNITLTLGGTPSTALLQSTSLTLGWTGTLAESRGGTGAASLSAGIDAAFGSTRGSILYRGALGWVVLAPGTSGYALVSNGAGADPTWEPSLGKRYINGLQHRWVSFTSTLVLAGQCRSKDDTANMTLAADVTVDHTAVGALGYERRTLTGTTTWTNASANITGSGTLFLSEFGTRSLGITGTTTGTSTTLTLASSCAGRLALNDLVGNSTRGFFRVTAVATDGTTVTLTVAPGSVTSNFTTEALSVIENPFIESAGGKCIPVLYITSDTALVLAVNADATESGVAAYASGGRQTVAGDTTSVRHLWLCSGTSGTTVLMSTQRTTPYLSTTGYTSKYRRIGARRFNTAGNANLIDHGLAGEGARRTALLRGGISMLANASSPITTPSALSTLTTMLVPNADELLVALTSDSPNTVSTVFLQARGGNANGFGVANTGLRLQVTAPSTSTRADVVGWVAVDPWGYVEHHAIATTGDGTTITGLGWREELE